jgi:hypothetical protein
MRAMSESMFSFFLGGVFVFALLPSAEAERWFSYGSDGTVCMDLDSIRVDQNGYAQFNASFNCPHNIHVEEEAVDCQRLKATAPDARARYMRYDPERKVWEQRLMVPNSDGRLKLEGVCSVAR